MKLQLFSPSKICCGHTMQFPELFTEKYITYIYVLRQYAMHASSVDFIQICILHHSITDRSWLTFLHKYTECGWDQQNGVQREIHHQDFNKCVKSTESNVHRFTVCWFLSALARGNDRCSCAAQTPCFPFIHIPSMPHLHFMTSSLLSNNTWNAVVTQ